MQITHTVSLLELIWTLVGIIGLIFISRIVWRSYSEIKWIATTKANGDHVLRKYSALTNILIFIGGVVTQLAYVLVGVIAMTVPTPGGRPHLPQILFSAIFITASLIGTTFSGIIYERRVKIVKMIEQDLLNKENHG